MNSHVTKTTDPIVQKVIEKLDYRSTVGLMKYGTSLDDNNEDDFLEHLQQELLDAANYVEKLISIRNGKGDR